MIQNNIQQTNSLTFFYVPPYFFVSFNLYEMEWTRFESLNWTLCGGLMVSALDSQMSGPGSSPGGEHCVVFLGKTLYSHSASLYCVQMGTGKFNAGGNFAMD